MSCIWQLINNRIYDDDDDDDDDDDTLKFGPRRVLNLPGNFQTVVELFLCQFLLWLNSVFAAFHQLFFSISVCCRWDSQFVILRYLLKDSFSTHENKFCKLWQAQATFYILAMSDMFVCLYVSVFVRLCIQLFIVFVPCLEILCVVLGGVSVSLKTFDWWHIVTDLRSKTKVK